MFGLSRRINWKGLTQFTSDCYFQAMMGHRLRAKSQAELVDKLSARGFLTMEDPVVLDKLKTIDRANFLPLPTPATIYDNIPQKLQPSSHSMSTPQLHAQIISLLETRFGPNRVACEIGCGSGYLPAVMHALGTERVFAIEQNPDLLKACHANLSDCESVVIGQTPKDVVLPLDALYISTFFESEAALMDYLTQFDFNPDACVVAVFQDPEPSLIDQQLVLLTRESSWQKNLLFRVLCEPMIV